MKKFIIILIPFSILGLYSCTDLEPEVFTEISEKTFLKTEAQVLSTAGPAYSSLNVITAPEGIWGLNDLTTDELLIPTRGIHWYNAGMYHRFHRHQWTAQEGIINNAWRCIYGGVTNCNRAIFLCDQVEDPTPALVSIKNELAALRAFFMFLAMDMYGGVPIVDRFDVPEGYAPARNTRAEVFSFIESSLKEGVKVLNPTKDLTTYGRFHKWSAYTLLAKLYLNAQIYIGAPMWDEAIAACDSIINSGLYALNPDYFKNFAINNDQELSENIFVVPFTDVNTPVWGDAVFPVPRMFQHNFWTIHFVGNEVFGMTQGGWDGMCAVPSFYKSYDSTDIRRNVWLTGVQISKTGDTLRCNQEKKGQILEYTVEVTDLEASYENEGARLVKYDYTDAQNNQLANDWVVFRYADVLLMKAEAIMRKNGGVATQEAVDLVNQVRARAFPGDATKLYTIPSLTLNALLSERGWELASEGWRRNDLIRFGKYNDPLDFRPVAASEIYNLFPIPQDQINANPNLTQNPGY